jgi:hypothetical protein
MRIDGNRRFEPGEVIKHYGVYRCGCGAGEFFGVSGRVFPREHCEQGWTLILRAREEKHF